MEINKEREQFIRLLLNEIEGLFDRINKTENKSERLVILVQLAEKLYKTMEEVIKYVADSKKLNVDWHRHDPYQYIIYNSYNDDKTRGVFYKAWSTAQNIHTHMFHEVPYTHDIYQKLEEVIILYGSVIDIIQNLINITI